MVLSFDANYENLKSSIERYFVIQTDFQNVFLTIRASFAQNEKIEQKILHAKIVSNV